MARKKTSLYIPYGYNEATEMEGFDVVGSIKKNTEVNNQQEEEISGLNVTIDEDTESGNYLVYQGGKLVGEIKIDTVVEDAYYDPDTKELVLVISGGREVRIPMSFFPDNLSSDKTLNITSTVSSGITYYDFSVNIDEVTIVKDADTGKLSAVPYSGVSAITTDKEDKLIKLLIDERDEFLTQSNSGLMFNVSFATINEKITDTSNPKRTRIKYKSYLKILGVDKQDPVETIELDGLNGIKIEYDPSGSTSANISIDEETVFDTGTYTN